MSLESLLKSDGIKETNKKISLDYSKLDPDHVKKEEKKEKELSSIFREARIQSEKIKKDARLNATSIVEKANKEAIDIKDAALSQKEQMLADTKIEAKKIIDADRVDIEQEKIVLNKEKEVFQQQIEQYKIQVKEEITKEIWATIRVESEQKILEEYTRLLDQVHAILNEAIRYRREVLVETENDISELVILIAKKVVKVLSKNDNNIVVQNVVQALGKLKGREKFLIRINASHLQDLKKYIPNIKKQLDINGVITLVEDTSVDLGGCIIETEFGEIDARIATQLAEIEKRIRDTEFISNVKF